MPELPPLPQPYPYLRVGHYGAAALPEGIGTHIDLTRVDVDQALADGLDCVVVSAAGSTERFAPQMLQLLTACEAAGVPTVLRTGLQEDLRSPVAAVVSHLALETEELYGQALRMVGPERAFAIQQPVDPCQVLTQGTEDPHQLSPEAIAERREALAEKSPRAQADRFMRFIGLPVEPEPLVTALIISRHAKNLHYSLENLKRQNYPRIDPLLVIDPIYEQQAREITADWDIPVRIAAANPRSLPADKLNIGAQHAHGEVVAVIEETGLYGADYLTDQLQALQASGAHLVGKASWFVWDPKKQRTVVTAAAKQRRFDQVPALGTMVFHRETGRVLGFTRRAPRVNEVFADRIRTGGGRVYVSHSFDTVLLSRGQTVEDLADGPMNRDTAWTTNQSI
ncbi:MAG: hypothetical protein ACTHWO_06790 [Nesterenkonia sp.]